MNKKLLSIALLVGCNAATADQDDGRDDAFLGAGKADTGGIAENSPDALAVLDLANTASEELLLDTTDGVGLSERAVDNIAYFRLGDDGVAGTADDGHFDTLAELDAVPYIGPIAFDKLLRYVRAHRTYTIGGPGVGAMSVDDYLVIDVNGSQVYSDAAQGYGTRNPFSLQVQPGAIVTMSFFNTGGPNGHSDLWLSGPGVAPHQIAAGFGSSTNYPGDTIQPFDIVVFKVPAAGQTAERQCLPDIPLNTANWHPSPNLSIHHMSTKDYDATWTVNQHRYRFTPDCNGWIGDTFIAPGNSWAYVRWNTITNQLETSAIAGHPYTATSARTVAQYAVSTLFPPGDLALLTIK